MACQRQKPRREHRLLHARGAVQLAINKEFGRRGYTDGLMVQVVRRRDVQTGLCALQLGQSLLCGKEASCAVNTAAREQQWRSCQHFRQLLLLAIHVPGACRRTSVRGKGQMTTRSAGRSSGQTGRIRPACKALARRPSAEPRLASHSACFAQVHAQQKRCSPACCLLPARGASQERAWPAGHRSAPGQGTCCTCGRGEKMKLRP